MIWYLGTPGLWYLGEWYGQGGSASAYSYLPRIRSGYGIFRHRWPRK